MQTLKNPPKVICITLCATKPSFNMVQTPPYPNIVFFFLIDNMYIDSKITYNQMLKGLPFMYRGTLAQM